MAPDLTEEQIEEIAGEVTRRGIDGMIVSNTTLSREGVTGLPDATEAGGLSGAPLAARATYVLARFRKALGPDMPLIGVGGIDSAAEAIRRIEAGADLVQLYTALVYHGPELPGAILRGILRYLDRAGIDSLRELRDRGVDAVLADPPTN